MYSSLYEISDQVLPTLRPTTRASESRPVAMTTSGWRGCLPFTLCHLGNDGSDLGDDVDGFEAQAAGAAGQELGTNGRLHLLFKEEGG